MPAEAQTKLFDVSPEAKLQGACRYERGHNLFKAGEKLAKEMGWKFNWRIVDAPIEVYFCAIGVQKGNDALREKLNGAIKDMHKSGFVDERWKKWFGGPMLHDPRTAPTYK